MPWLETAPVEQRERFIGDVDAGLYSMTELCERYGISRTSGYKWVARAEAGGRSALADRSRAPHHCPHRIPATVAELLCTARRKHPQWGPKKLLDLLRPRHRRITAWPAVSTVGDLFEREGLITKRRRRRRAVHPGTVPPHTTAPNDIWAADFKGQFRTGDGVYCYPLTITDQHSRYLLTCHSLRNVQTVGARPAFERAFREYGLPLAIRTDNGVPFSSRSAFFGLSKLSVWWLRLGIGIERIMPGKPQQNGRHERMHLTLKKEATKPAGKNFLQQQGKFDQFIEEYNHDRPHQALEMKYPGELYSRSPRPYTGLSDVEYPFHDRTITVTTCGRICIGKRKINLSTVFAGQNVGITEVSEKIWMVSFMRYDLGFFDHEVGRVECAENPFGAKVLPMCPV